MSGTDEDTDPGIRPPDHGAGREDPATGSRSAGPGVERRDPSTDTGEAAIPDKLFFRIGEAAQLVGVEAHVLRYWETEFRVRPQRSSTGQRMYRRKDISRFLKIKRLLHDEGFTIAGARKALADPGDAGSPGNPTGVDSARAREVLARIADLRKRVATMRARVASSGVADTPPHS